MGVLLYPPIKERRLLDRPLLLVGVAITSLISFVFGFTPEEQQSEVVNVPVENIEVIPLRQLTYLEAIPEVVQEVSAPAGVPKDTTKRCPKWETKFREYGLPVVAFSYIAWRESRCNPQAWNRTLNANGSQDLGLVQVNSSWKTVTKNICGTDIKGLFNVDCNLSVARYLYDNGGLGHWRL